MAEFPTYEKMASVVAEKALDEYLYKGKTIREWIKIIAEQEPKTDVLDKIKTEITEKENALDCAKVSDVALKTAYIEALKIIDKYRQEG